MTLYNNLLLAQNLRNNTDYMYGKVLIEPGFQCKWQFNIHAPLSHIILSRSPHQYGIITSIFV